MNHPLLDLLELNVRGLGHLELYNLAVTIGNAIVTHEKYAVEPPPPPISDGNGFLSLASKYKALLDEADTGNRYKKAERDALRPAVEVEVEMFRNWAQYKAYKTNDLVWVTNVGIPHKTKVPVARTSAASHAVGTPERIKVDQGPTGSVLITVNKVAAALLYYVQFCQGDPSDEAAWQQFDKFHGCRNMQVTGLEPGKVYHFRVRAYGAAGYGPHSAIVKTMVT